MALEIERKFLVELSLLPALPEGTAIKQGYIKTIDLTAVRVRVKGDQAFLTIKGANKGAVRSEFEYPIPMADAEGMLAELCHGPLIDKHRYELQHAGLIWELDIFHGDNDGLVVAEVELDSAQQQIELPSWVGEEVTGESRYYNACLLDRPFKHW